MHAPIKYFEKGLSLTANGAWFVFSNLNKIAQNPSFTPKWADKPLLKSYQKTKPPLGWPRETDSLCPVCTREARHTWGMSSVSPCSMALIALCSAP